MKKLFTQFVIRILLPFVTILSLSTNTNGQCTDPPICTTQNLEYSYTGMPEILNASAFDNGSMSQCGGGLTFTIEGAETFSPVCDDVGVNTIDIIVTDDLGNASACTATLTVTNDVTPQCIVADIAVTLDAMGMVEVEVDEVDLASFSDCGEILSMTLSDSLFDCSNLGDNTVTFAIVSEGGTCEQEVTITVEDAAPLCGPAEATVELDEDGMATYTVPTTDNCSTVTADPAEFVYTCDDLAAPAMETYIITDEAGNTTECMITVTVIDLLAPIADPNPEVIVVQLMANQCDSVVMFDLPLPTDNCDMAPTATAIVGEPASGDVFETGTTTINYTIEDAEGNSDVAQLEVVLEEFVPDGLACLTNINLSIDAVTCESELTPEMVLTTTQLGCAENCTIIVMDEDGNEFPNLFTAANVGNSYMYQVTCGDLSCMGTVHVEDKAPPMIECSNDTITCAQLVTFGLPVVTENCTVASLLLINEEYEDVDCSDAELQQIIRRTYQATDGAGNESNICEQLLSIAKFDIGTVDAPLDLTINMECAEPFAMNDVGNPDPEVYGSPRLGGMNLWPDQFLVCNLMVNYSDETVPTGFNSYSIVRTWSATNWACGSDTTRTFVQLFNFSDTQGPDFTCPGNMEFTTSGLDCAAEVELPALDIVDACGDLKSVVVQYEGGFIEGNGGLAALPVGTYDVTYIATDLSNNTSECSFEVSVADQQQPTPICDQFTTVSLTNDGIAEVDASEFDDGSYDDCGPVTILIRRMNPNCEPTDVVFGESVTFCCADIGTEQMVVLRVTDESGNYNECMVTAEVQDKIAPVILQGLPDITLSCEFPFNENDTEQFGTIQMDVDDIEPILLTAELVQFNGPATDGFVLGNCLELESDEFTFSNFGDCGTGSATRILTFINQQGITASDVQNITFVNPSPFDGDDIDFPNDLEFFNVCSLDDLNPANLPNGFNYPTYTEDGCDQVGVDYDDKVIDNSNGSLACFKIIRTWTIVDWCQIDGGTFVSWEDDQIIEVYNTIAPEVTGSCENQLVESVDNNCGAAFISLVNTATDDCTATEMLNWTYNIDAFSDGSMDITGSTNDASGSYPVGVHTIFWSVNDGCGNTDACSYTFEISNIKKPTAYCFDNLTTALTPWDSTGDGEPDVESVTLTPAYFDAGSFHACGGPVQLSFSSDVNDTERYYDCDDLGEQPIELWVTYSNGQQDYCSTSIVVMDNNDVDLCPEMLTVDVTGELKTEDDEMIALGVVNLDGTEMSEITQEDGAYSFLNMPLGGSYVVNPVKDQDDLNGITTLDIILIQKHILGISVLNSPYKMIAADINSSETINGQDIIQLRKLLLGYYEQFPDNDSWRFIDADYDFIDTNNPWIGELPESYAITDLQSNMIVDFRGIKIGDVNNSAQPNGLVGEDAVIRSANNLDLAFDAKVLENGEDMWMPIYATNMNEVHGLQLGLNYANADVSITDVRSGALTLDNTNYVLNENTGSLKMIWTADRGVSIDADNALFEVRVEAKQKVDLAEVFALDDQVIRNESYDQTLTVDGISLTARSSDSKDITVQLSMSQNEPNPWRNETSITIESAIAGNGKLRVMDLSGKVILQRTITIESGVTSISLKNTELPSNGVLYYELELNDNRIMKKMILID